MVVVKVNGKNLAVAEGITILEACKEAGIEIPRFCYHEKLSIAGNCRMCLVEVEKSLKPVASCAMPVMGGMEIKTDTELVKKAREGAMEFLLANHPLDCPICDQGGECDLQDQAMVFGNDRGRYYEEKRAVEDKNCGPLVKTIMTRCIHCTRCVRYATEIAGIGDLGVTGRGNSMEIGTYVNKMFLSEISGNVIDLCPVGALTSKPYAYSGRSWELKEINNIDLSDNLGANINICVRGVDLMRVLPRRNELVNEEWITDKTRFNYDGNNRQRLVSPMIRDKNGKLETVTWEGAFSKIERELLLGNKDLIGVAGSGVDLESLINLQTLGYNYGNFKLTSVVGDVKNTDIRGDYLVNKGILGIEEADVCVLIGCNLRKELPLWAVRLRKRQKEGKVIVYSIGVTSEPYFEVNNVGNSFKSVIEFFEGKALWCSKFSAAKKPMVIVGNGDIYEGKSEVIKTGLDILGTETNLVTESWDGRCYLNYGVSSVGIRELGGTENISLEKKNKIYYILNGDEIKVNKKEGDIIIYQGHHGDVMAENADIILPGSTNFEKDGLYVNMEGRVQEALYAVKAPGDAREDWKILRGLVEYLYSKKGNLEYSIEEVRRNLEKKINYRIGNRIKKSIIMTGESSSKKAYYGGMLSSSLNSFYLTDSMSRASRVMGMCSTRINKYMVNYRWKL